MAPTGSLVKRNAATSLRTERRRSSMEDTFQEMSTRIASVVLRTPGSQAGISVREPRPLHVVTCLQHLRNPLGGPVTQARCYRREERVANGSYGFGGYNGLGLIDFLEIGQSLRAPREAPT